MAPADSWIEWFDHGNIDHYYLFNIQYIILPKQIRPPHFLIEVYEEGDLNNNNNNNKKYRRHFQVYKVKRSNYFIVTTRCHTHGKSMKYNNCLHPLFHDAKPGRGYGRGFDSVDKVDDDWQYTMSAPPKFKKRPLTLYQMDHRKPSELPISRFKIVQRKSKILHETISPNTYSCKVKVGKKELMKDDGIFVVLKVNYHPHWNCNINNEKQVQPILRVAPGYLAVQLYDEYSTSSRDDIEFDIQCTYNVPLYKNVLLLIPLIIFGGWIVFMLYQLLYKKKKSKEE